MRPLFCFLQLALFAASLSSAIAEETRLSLDECIQRGLAGNKVLQAAELDKLVADAALKQAYTLYLPSLTVSGGYARVNPQDEFSITIPMAGSYVLSPSIEDNWLLRVELRQNVFTGFKTKSLIDQAHSICDIQNASYRRERDNTVFMITNSYLELIKAVDYNAFVEENITLARARVSEVKNLFQQGLVTNNEVLKTELELSSAEMQKIDARNNLLLARARLGLLIGFKLDTAIIPDAFAPPADQEQNEALEASVARALANRNELAAAQGEIRAGESGIRNASSSLYPLLILKGNYTLANPNPAVFPREAEWNGTWEIGLALCVDLGAYPQALFKIEEARSRLDSARKRFDSLQENISFEVLASHLEQEKMSDRVRVAKKMLDQAGENLRVVTEKNKNGMATTTDVLDARISFLKAELLFSQSRINQEIARISLMHARGESWKHDLP